MQLRIAGSSTPFLRHFCVEMRREIGTYMFCPHLKMPVLSSLIYICAFAESFRNRLAFDDTNFHLAPSTMAAISDLGR